LMRYVGLGQLFAISGGLLVLIVLLTFALSGMRTVSDQRAAAPR
jgi:uncharacterized integral membrane protein